MSIHIPQLPLAVQPIDTLPVEILATVLTLTLPPIYYAQAPQRRNLALVCRRWNVVIESTPSFWSKISSEDSLAHVEKALTKSKDCPIDLYSDWPYFYAGESWNPPRRDRFLELANRHIERWRHVTLDVRDEDRFPFPVTPAPLLESLKVSLGSTVVEAETPVKITMFDSTSTPRLREFWLDNVGMVEWKKPFSPTLSELTIKNVEYRGGPSLSELLTILISCPNINVLEVSNVGVELDPEEGWTSTPLVEFPDLQKLTLCDLEDQVTEEIFRRLRFPADCAVRLFSGLLPPYPSASLTSMFSHHLDNPNHVVIDQLTIWIRGIAPRGIIDVIRIEGPRWNVTFELDDMEAMRDAVLWFNGNESTRSIPVSLELDYDVRAYGIELLSPIIDLQCITRIALNSGGLTELSQPLDTVKVEGDKQSWPFPAVRELHVKHPKAEMHPIIKLVGRRRGKRDGLGAAGSLQKIKFGDEFNTVKPAQPDSLLLLLDVVDEGAEVYWYGKQVLRDC
ncbi:hypothetical protein FRC00_001034 [Tulasnella sp. 408]|nr:hypothetical protein FRC00_001034 [Tulasnella sp. 408]